MPAAIPPAAEALVEGIIASELRDARNPITLRRACVLALGLYGLRTQEICNLTRRDLHPTEHTLTVNTLKKGRRRRLGIDPLIAANVRALNAGADLASPLIPTRTGKTLDVKSCKRYASWLAEVTGTRLSMHSLRHTAAQRVWRETGDVLQVMRMLGHATLHQTHVYLQTIRSTGRELGPNFHHGAAAPELIAYNGPPTDEARRRAYRTKLIEGRVPPRKTYDRPSGMRHAATLQYIQKKLHALSKQEADDIVQQLVIDTWPRAADRAAKQANKRKGNNNT